MNRRVRNLILWVIIAFVLAVLISTIMFHYPYR